MKATFEIEWPDHLGPEWVNKDKLAAALDTAAVEGMKVVRIDPDLIISKPRTLR